MYTGQLLMGGANVLSPWFPREADNAIFSWEKIQVMGGVSLTVTVWHKNTEEIGQGTELTAGWSTSGNITYHKFEGLKELVRFEYTVSGFSNPLAVSQNGQIDVTLAQTDLGWIMFRMLAPTWFNAANAS